MEPNIFSGSPLPTFGTLPVPTAHAEPLQKLLDALVPGKTLLFLRAAHDDAAQWLTEARITDTLRQVLLDSAHFEIWPLLADTWAVRLCLHITPDDPASLTQIHALRRALHDRLCAAWQQQASGEADTPPPFTLQPCAPLLAGADSEDHIAELNALLEIIVNKQLGSQFQPIVDLRDGHVLGYEALIRGPKGQIRRRFGQMFHAAEKASIAAWFDVACQEQCFAHAAQIGLKKLLFINMDAAGLAYFEMQERSLADRARDVGLAPSQIVIEITERQAVEEFPRLIQFISDLREEGFKIAIDDAGAGYNSLHTIAEIRPDFVKIDRNLTRNIDVRGERRALLAALVQYARQIGTAILAEGSETREELGTLIDLGVSFGQGYLMGRPADDFRGIHRDIREFIQRRAMQRNQTLLGRMILVGGLTRKGLAFAPDTPIATAAQRFAKDESLTSVVIVEEDRPVGLLMRHQMQNYLAMTNAAGMGDLLPDETLEQWMSAPGLLARADTPLNEIARQATTRTGVNLEDDVIVLGPEGKFAGVVPIRLVLEAAANVQENRQRYAEPLTGLPGRLPLERAVHERVAERTAFAALRVDIGHLEAFNRRYGVMHGDEVILALSRLLQNSIEECGSGEDFLAHLGGDDFVLLTAPHCAAPIGQFLHKGFAALLPQFYPQEDWRRGGFELPEPGGNLRRVPLFHLRLATLSSTATRITHIGPLLRELHAQLRQSDAKTHAAPRPDRLPLAA